MPIIEFTLAFMATGLICPPDKKRIEYSVAGGPGGLFVECRSTPGAVPTWYLRLKNAQGTNVYRRLGTVQELTLTQAKKQALIVKAEHALALKEERAKPVTLSRDMTLDTFWEEHYFPFAKIHKRSWPKDESMYRLRIKPKFGASKLSEITRYQAQQFQNELSGETISPATNDHHLRLLKRLLSLATQWEMLERNVLARFPLLLVDNQVENYLDEAAMQRLMTVLQSYPNKMIASALMILATTGMRYAEAFYGRWDEVNLENGTWRIGGDRNKSKRQKIVYLNESATQILQQVGTQGKSEYIFPNPSTGKPFSNIAKQWDTIRTLAKLSEKTRMHDLRHTFATRVLAAGRSLFEVQKLLFHADSKTTLRYSHISEQQLREAASAAVVTLPSLPMPPAPMAVAPSESTGVAVQEAAPASNVVVFPKAA